MGSGVVDDAGARWSLSAAVAVGVVAGFAIGVTVGRPATDGPTSAEPAARERGPSAADGEPTLAGSAPASPDADVLRLDLHRDWALAWATLDAMIAAKRVDEVIAAARAIARRDATPKVLELGEHVNLLKDRRTPPPDAVRPGSGYSPRHRNRNPRGPPTGRRRRSRAVEGGPASSAAARGRGKRGVDRRAPCLAGRRMARLEVGASPRRPRPQPQAPTRGRGRPRGRRQARADRRGGTRSRDGGPRAVEPAGERRGVGGARRCLRCRQDARRMGARPLDPFASAASNLAAPRNDCCPDPQRWREAPRRQRLNPHVRRAGHG
jgi:hypothetical protein